MTSVIGTRARNPRSNRAFTLIELMLVVLLVLVLTGLSMPLFKQSFAGLQRTGASRRIAEVARYAQEMAIYERVNYKLNFNFDLRTFWLTKIVLKDGVADYRSVGGRYGKIFTVPNELELRCPAGSILFYPDGRCEGNDVSVTARDGERQVIRIRDYANPIEIDEQRVSLF